MYVILRVIDNLKTILAPILPHTAQKGCKSWLLLLLILLDSQQPLAGLAREHIPVYNLRTEIESSL